MPSALKGILKAPNSGRIAKHAHLLLTLLVQVTTQARQSVANGDEFFVLDGGTAPLLDTVFVRARTRRLKGPARRVDKFGDEAPLLLERRAVLLNEPLLNFSCSKLLGWLRLFGPLARRCHEAKGPKQCAKDQASHSESF
jgi:hypothetical protein